MATNDEKNMQDNNDMIKNNTLYPDAIIEEEIVETIFITDVDDDDSDENEDMTDSAGSDYDTESMESVSGMDYIPDPSAGINNENNLSGQTDISATTDTTDTGMNDKEKNDKEKDDKKNKDTDNGDNDPIEDLDDKIVSETNELIEEKRAERHHNGCGC